MSTAIVKQGGQGLSVYGERDHVVSLANRMRNMIPGTAEAPDDVIWKAAQIAQMHRLDPFGGDVQVYKIAGTWITNIGIGAWRREAQRQAKYIAQYRPLTEDELKRIRGDKWDKDDVGSECSIYRLDVARECKDLGIPYTPEKAIGLWCKKAHWNKFANNNAGAWQEDGIPNTETKESVAERRAEKKALKKAFSLGFPDIEENYELDVQRLSAKVELREMERLPMIERRDGIVEDDGDVMFAASEPKRADTKVEEADVVVVGVEKPKRPVANGKTPAAAVLNTLTVEQPEQPQDDSESVKKEKLHKRFHATGNDTFGKLWAEKGKEIIYVVTAGESKSSAALTDEEKLVLIKSFAAHKTAWENWADGSSADMPVVPVREVAENPFN